MVVQAARASEPDPAVSEHIPRPGDIRFIQGVTAMMNVEVLRRLCEDVRARRVDTDDDLIHKIESDVREYRGFLRDRAELPPDELVDRLWYMGWLIYEATWQSLDRIAPGFEKLTDERREASREVQGLIARGANAARFLPWPEFAPRALGAVRAEALAASKRDTEDGYNDAWILHAEAKKKYEWYRNYHVGRENRDHLLLALDEVLVQLALAETGTACRTAERVISRWTEEEEFGFTQRADERWTERMFPELLQGVTVGEQALEMAATIEKEHGLVQQVDEHRLALVTSFQNPGIMTARAALLMLGMCAEMESLGRRPLPGDDSWKQSRESLIERFENAYRYIERDIPGAKGIRLPLHPAHARSVVQLRLNLALLVPGHRLPARMVFDPVVEVDPLDDEAIEALSAWLAESVDGKQRGDANVIGSATKPGFIRSVLACRAAAGATADGYLRWRHNWPVLDRYVTEPGRAERVEQALRVGQEGYRT
jgi:hypothetical protein